MAATSWDRSLPFSGSTEPAAETFDRADELTPLFTYAYCYAGISSCEVSRINLMTIRFDRFLKLAPDAP